MTQFSIRNAVAEDSILIVQFIRELARYEKAEHEVHATEQSIRETIFGSDSTTHALICELDGKAVGFAVYFLTTPLG